MEIIGIRISKDGICIRDQPKCVQAISYRRVDFYAKEVAVVNASTVSIRLDGTSIFIPFSVTPRSMPLPSQRRI